jgi:hypothetical protein
MIILDPIFPFEVQCVVGRNGFTDADKDGFHTE